MKDVRDMHCTYISMVSLESIDSYIYKHIFGSTNEIRFHMEVGLKFKTPL